MFSLDSNAFCTQKDYAAMAIAMLLKIKGMERFLLSGQSEWVHYAVVALGVHIACRLDRGLAMPSQAELQRIAQTWIYACIGGGIIPHVLPAPIKQTVNKVTGG